jgi:purine-binding chemotaxis protein CheW
MSAHFSNDNATADQAASTFDYVTVTVADQLFGLPIERVHDVFLPTVITKVPLAPREIVGLLNLRGKVVTAICLRARLDLPARVEVASTMAVGIEHLGESYGLMVDGVGEVLRLPRDQLEPAPIHLDARWGQIAKGIHRLEDKLLIILDVDSILAFVASSRAA